VRRNVHKAACYWICEEYAPGGPALHDWASAECIFYSLILFPATYFISVPIEASMRHKSRSNRSYFICRARDRERGVFRALS